MSKTPELKKAIPHITYDLEFDVYYCKGLGCVGMATDVKGAYLSWYQQRLAMIEWYHTKEWCW